MRYVTAVCQAYPGRRIGVIVPELVQRHWYNFLVRPRASLLNLAVLRAGSTGGIHRRAVVRARLTGSRPFRTVAAGRRFAYRNSRVLLACVGEALPVNAPGLRSRLPRLLVWQLAARCLVRLRPIAVPHSVLSADAVRPLTRFTPIARPSFVHGCRFILAGGPFRRRYTRPSPATARLAQPPALDQRQAASERCRRARAQLRPQPDAKSVRRPARPDAYTLYLESQMELLHEGLRAARDGDLSVRMPVDAGDDAMIAPWRGPSTRWSSAAIRPCARSSASAESSCKRATPNARTSIMRAACGGTASARSTPWSARSRGAPRKSRASSTTSPKATCRTRWRCSRGPAAAGRLAAHRRGGQPAGRSAARVRSEVTRVAREVGTEGKLGGQADVEGASPAPGRTSPTTSTCWPAT